jgi:hypothetical protein
LREQVLAKQFHKVIRLHQDCFEATVNACIISITNKANGSSQVIAADLTNISTRKDVDEVREKLYHLERFIGQSTPRFAVYQYPQALIRTNSNQPIFVGSPKLFALMNDMTCTTESREIGGKLVKVRKIHMNGKIIELVRFGDIADIRQGLATGDNHSYLFQNPTARGSYRNIDQYKKYLLSDADLEKIVHNDNVRLKVIEKGIHKSRDERGFEEDRWFNGRYIVPYDKGGESDTSSGWLPNYYIPVSYYIDWSQSAVIRMKTLTIKQRDGKGDNRICSRFQNKEYYFMEGISFSWAGIYCPTYRQNLMGPFDHGSSNIFCNTLDIAFLLAVLASKVNRFLSRVIINHSINFGIDDTKEIPVLFDQNQEVINLVNQLIDKQKNITRYDYANNEQKEIDQVIYSLYGLDTSDIEEVETWYTRRYPKLAR